ncbi:hypothetical protein SD70_18715 [Gordoniibacillus kamchatkensis]|uniref:Uncharacterized protein n=1 Tax=Gordoniibacillus kamchatkensis TaxID=1590651 RepID=A0ABR5AF63_9BACL|nr:hypothetical protein [Paenibacillus sp. VKM B-2647]KIL39669.1 hypothetical protein SD70_18715 [Paenibacillus sp. VKM B-2647]
MKQRKLNMITGTLATAFILGGSFAGTVHKAYADDSGASSNSAPAATTNAAAVQDTIAGVPVPVFAKLHGVDLRLGKAALSTAEILNKDLEDVYADMTWGSSLSQIGTNGASDYMSQLLRLTQDNIDAAVSAGNITAAQGTQLSSYASRVLNQEINDAKYRDYDNSSVDPVAYALLSNDTDRADVAQLLGMSQNDLFDALAGGQSLGIIAEGKGVADDQLAAKLQGGLAQDLKPIVWSDVADTAAAAAPAATSGDAGAAAPAASTTPAASGTDGSATPSAPAATGGADGSSSSGNSSGGSDAAQ